MRKQKSLTKNLRVDYYQRWSRGHKARGQGQGHKKIRAHGQGQPFQGQNLSRPRTGMLEAKAMDRGHRRKFSSKKKKVFKNIFQAISYSLAYPEFLIKEGLNHKSHDMTSSKFFQRGSFFGTKTSQDERSEIVVACLHVTRILQRKRA